MRKLISYITGALALLIVAAATVSALWYAVANGLATLGNLATSTLSGIGMAIGGCLGSALILRFKQRPPLRRRRAPGRVPGAKADDVHLEGHNCQPDEEPTK